MRLNWELTDKVANLICSQPKCIKEGGESLHGVRSRVHHAFVVRESSKLSELIMAAKSHHSPCRLRRTAFAFLLRLHYGRHSLSCTTRVASSFMSPRCERSKRAVVSALTTEEGAQGLRGPRTRDGSRWTMSHDAVRSLSPRKVTSRRKSNVHSPVTNDLLDLGREVVCCVPNVRRFSIAKPWFR